MSKIIKLVWNAFSNLDVIVVIIANMFPYFTLLLFDGLRIKPSTVIQVLVDMVRVPDWAFEAAGQEMRVIGQDATSYHPGLYLTTAQVSTSSLGA
jgi:E3 ubiquitin-protein ligase SIS3